MKKKLLIGCGGALALLAVFVGVLLLYGSKELKPEVVAFLTRARDGQVEVIFDASSRQFQEQVGFNRLKEELAFLDAALGPFQEAGAVTGTKTETSASGPVAEVTLKLKFQKGDTTGTFNFVSQDDAWKMLGFEVEVPENLRPGPDLDALEPLARSFLSAYSEGKTAVLFESFSPELREVLPAAQLEEQVRGLYQQMGPVRGATLGSRGVNEEGLHQLELAVDFEKGPGAATFKYVWRRTRFELTGFSMRPVEPQAASPDKGQPR